MFLYHVTASRLRRGAAFSLYLQRVIIATQQAKQPVIMPASVQPVAFAQLTPPAGNRFSAADFAEAIFPAVTVAVSRRTPPALKAKSQSARRGLITIARLRGG